jgi:hypothetical protein
MAAARCCPRRPPAALILESVRRDGFEPPTAAWATTLRAAALTALPPTLDTMTAVPGAGLEPEPSLCRSDTLPLRQPGWLLGWDRPPWQTMKGQGVRDRDRIRTGVCHRDKVELYR